jgi:hypothetical protein
MQHYKLRCIMSDGPTGNGTDYYASFRIAGDLDEASLKQVTAAIRAILEGQAANGNAVDGEILSAHRSGGVVTFGPDHQKKKIAPNFKITFE